MRSAATAWWDPKWPVRASVSAGIFGPHLALGQFGETLTVVLAGDEGFDHGPPRLG